MPSWLEHIKTWSEFRRFLSLLITVTVFVGGVAFGGAKFYIKKSLEKNREDVALQDTLSKFSELLEYVNVEQSFLSEDIAVVKDSLVSIVKAQEKQGLVMNHLVWVIKNLDTFSTEQLEIIWDEWLKKNNWPTVYKPPDDWINSLEYTGAVNQTSNLQPLTP